MWHVPFLPELEKCLEIDVWIPQIDVWIPQIDVWIPQHLFVKVLDKHNQICLLSYHLC